MWLNGAAAVLPFGAHPFRRQPLEGVDYMGRMLQPGMDLVRLLRLSAVRIRTAILVILLLVLGHAPALADKRVALTIGNSAYKNAPQLVNPTNDAAAVSALLRSAGFDVVEAKTNLGISEMRRAISDFSDVASGADIAVVYYAGHGIEVDGSNYLIPTDAMLRRDIDVDDEAVSLDRILRILDPVKRLRLVILDACRDNPFTNSMKRTLGTRAVTRGLAKVEPSSSDTLVAFAAKAGSVASDGDGPNSPFTAAMLKFIASPGLDLRLAFGKVRDEVIRTTGNRQEPFAYGSLGGSTVSLVPGLEKPSAESAKPIDENRLELAFWETIKNERNPQLFQAYLNRYPKGAFADIATIILQQQKTAALQSATVEQPNDRNELGDPGLLREVRERLYELNYDPGSFDGPIGGPARQAVREFEEANKLATTGEITQGLLRRLRDISGLKPWGAIVYSRTNDKWGMAWSHDTRKAAVASAQTSCGNGVQCPVEISFFGTQCGVFAHSGTNWAIVARDNIEKARADALSDCKKRGKTCRVIASVCADGAGRASVTD
ncbi:MAG: caspase family protein [Bradyrhizobium sp.]|uniref:caspase family protein n=1 Tax=Bradyrhizobium sp. TaxID=376 RepID=UPI002730D3C9|nr:caspase family protein [Bradyrhizobium sp.]MDP1865935.1 caspase family protein [Bradyrhizobium sp.]